MKIVNGQLSALVMPTKQCNMNCIYCFNQNRKTDHTRMSLDIFQRFLDITVPHIKHLTIIWHGGEPMLMGVDFYRSALEIERQYDGVEIRNRMQSNLTLLDDNWIHFFKENEISVGSSFDGTCNDNTRGNSEIILKNILKLKESEMSRGAISVISNKNIDCLIEDYLFFKKVGLNYTPNIYVANCEDVDDTLTLSVDYAIKKFCELYDYWIHDIDTSTHIRFFELYIDYCLRRTHNLCSLSSCLGHWIGIYPDGTIVPCNRSFSPDYTYGSVYAYDSIESAFDSEGFRMLLELAIKRREKCKSCFAYDMCVGGCNNIAYNQGGIDQNNGNHCQIFKGVYKHVIGNITDLLEKKDYTKINPIIKKELELYDKENAEFDGAS